MIYTVKLHGAYEKSTAKAFPIHATVKAKNHKAVLKILKERFFKVSGVKIKRKIKHKKVKKKNLDRKFIIIPCDIESAMSQ